MLEILGVFQVTIQTLVHIIFMIYLLTPRWKNKILTLAAAFIIVNTVNWIFVLTEYHYWKVYINLFVGFLWLIILFKDDFRHKIALECIYWSVCYCTEGIVNLLLPNVHPSLEGFDETKLFGGMLAIILLAFHEMLWACEIKKITAIWCGRVGTPIYLFIIMQTLLIVVESQLVLQNNILEVNGETVFAFSNLSYGGVYRMGILLMVLMDFILVRSIRNYAKKEWIKATIALMEKESEKAMQYYKDQQRQAAQMQRYRHDMKNQLSMVKMLADENPEKAKVYFKELMNKIET